MSQVILRNLLIIVVLTFLSYYVFHSFNLKLFSSLASVLLVIISFHPYFTKSTQTGAYADHGSKEQPLKLSSTECSCKNSQDTVAQLTNNPDPIPKYPVYESEKDLDNEKNLQNGHARFVADDVLSAEPETVESLDVPSRSLLQRRQVRNLRVVTDYEIAPKSTSLSTPLRSQHGLTPYLRGSHSETTSAKSPAVIPPNFSLATKRPLRRRHSTVLIATQRLEEDAKRREVPTGKASGAIARRAFGFEPTFGEWEKRAQADITTPDTKQRNLSQKL